MLAENLETFLDRCQSEDHELPWYVEKELRDYLSCGVLGHGFVRLKCSGCGKEERALAFSCKGRGFCPSCTGRRMAETAARLVDNVFPANVPVRQWVLSLPLEIRYRLANDSNLLSDVLAVFPASSKEEQSADTPTTARRNSRMTWAMLLARTFGLKLERCSQCGAEMKVVAVITDPSSIRRYLEGTGQSAAIPEIAPARAPSQLDFTHLNRMFLVSSNLSRERIW